MNTPSVHTAPAHKASEGVAGRHHGRMAACLGAVLLVAALVCNEWALAHLFSNDGRVDGFNLFLVRAFQVVAAGAGIGLVLWRNSIRLMGLAVALASILVVFVAAELFFRMLGYMSPPHSLHRRCSFITHTVPVPIALRRTWISLTRTEISWSPYAPILTECTGAR